MISKQKIIYSILEKFEEIINAYWTYTIRPAMSNEVSKGNKSFSDPSTAIMLQGPIVYKRNFTVETVKLYAKRYPECKIIVSTWKEEKEINELEKIENVYVCFSDKPVPGRGNVNMQKVSTLAGIKKAKELGCKYFLKTRTDQRIYGSEIISFCIKLLAFFPIKGNTNASGRLITTSTGTFKSRLYNICDMFLFGHIEDVERFFDAPSVENLPSGYKYDESKPIEYAKSRPGEIHFTVNYLEKIGHNIKWNFEDSDFVRNHYFIVVDNSTLDILWPKYDHKEYRWKSYDKNFYLQQCSFSEWMAGQEKEN